MYTVYVIKNKSGVLYKGYTTDVTKRVIEHNSISGKWTSTRGPWQLVYSEQWQTKSHALKRERFLKSGKGRAFLRNILQ
jgi:putative endonuclease